MPAKMSQISPTTTIPVARGVDSSPRLASVCRKAGKAQIFTPVRESSGESRIRADASSLAGHALV